MIGLLVATHDKNWEILRPQLEACVESMEVRHFPIEFFSLIPWVCQHVNSLEYLEWSGFLSTTWTCVAAEWIATTAISLVHTLDTRNIPF